MDARLDGIDHMTFKHKVLAGIAAAALVLAAAACTRSNEMTPVPQTTVVEIAPGNEEVDLIAGRHWQMAGVEVRGNTLEVHSKQLAITQQDGSEGQGNPPINLYGNRLDVSGDFSVLATFSDIEGEVGFSLYGRPPVIEDEFRAETATLDMAIEEESFWVGLSNATEGNYAEDKNFAIIDKQEHSLEILKEKNKLRFIVDGKEVGSILDHDVFGSGQVWIGMDARTPDSRFVLTNLKARGLNGGEVMAFDTRSLDIAQDSHGLNALAGQKRKGFLIGAAVALGPMVADQEYRRALRNFGSVSIENALKAQFVHPRPGNSWDAYNFSEPDAIVEMAHKAGMKVHGHAIVFGEANPAWMQEMARDKPQEFRQAHIDHVDTVVSRYKGKIQSWDINEVLADYNTEPGDRGLRKNIYYNAVGANYIIDTARAIKKADPNAEIWLNEFGMESDDGRFEQMLDVLNWLKSQGVTVAGVGFQGHINEGDVTNGTLNKDKLRGRIEALARLGYKSRISELDITDQSQSNVFSDVVDTCMRLPSCVSVTTWGITDKYSSSGVVTDTGVLKTGEGLLWTSSYAETVGLLKLKGTLGLSN